MLSVFLFVVVFVGLCLTVTDMNTRYVVPSDTSVLDELCVSDDGCQLYSENSLEDDIHVDVCSDCTNGSDSDNRSELWVDITVSTLDIDDVVLLYPNTIELLTDMFNELPARTIKSSKYGWNVA